MQPVRSDKIGIRIDVQVRVVEQSEISTWRDESDCAVNEVCST